MICIDYVYQVVFFSWGFTMRIDGTSVFRRNEGYFWQLSEKSIFNKDRVWKKLKSEELKLVHLERI